MRRVIHAITPGDHYSPRTGSAIPTVVDGLAAASAAGPDSADYEHFVAIESGTFEPRYPSARAIEFPHVDAPTRRQRTVDAALGRIGVPRRAAARYAAPQARALREQAPAIVIAHNETALPRLLRDSPHQVVLYAHNDVLRSMTRAEAGRTLGGVGAIVAVSEFLAGRLADRLPAELARRVHVVRNGVDATRFTPVGAGADGGAPSGKLRVMYVGRMIPDKGPDLLLTAAAQTGRDDLELVLVGSYGFDPNSPLTAYELELRARAQSVRAPVRFVPSVARGELAPLLQSADVLVVPSRWPEPCGLTVGEGMAAGLAVAAAQIGGIPEVLGSAGALFPRDDAGALAGVLEALADDPALRARMSADARRRAVEYDWSWSWARLRDVLDGLPV